MAAEPQRPDGWVVTFVVEVVFDTNASRTGYDHVGTVVRCTGCGERLDASSPAVVARHARRHEPRLADAVNCSLSTRRPTIPPDRELPSRDANPAISTTPSLVSDGRR